MNFDGICLCIFCSEKQREFYKNAKHVNKYKKLVKHQNNQNERPSSSTLGLVEVCCYLLS